MRFGDLMFDVFRLWVAAWCAVALLILTEIMLFIAGVWVDPRFAGTGGVLFVPAIAALVAMGFWSDEKPWRNRQSPVTKVSRSVRKELRREHERRLMAEARAETTRVLEIETGMRRDSHG